MANTLCHRGPDAGGIWSDVACGVGLGHRRLAIIDLSDAGAQPMASASGRFVIVFNGEIYNYKSLTEELRQVRAGKIEFRGHSDTEVMLHAFEAWGVSEAVKRFNGMFAFAVWDRTTNRLYLGRDRAGEKPLYYGWSGQTFFFASELRALRAHSSFKPEIDRNALALYARYGYVPSEYSIYKGIQKLRPGTIVEVSRDSQSGNLIPRPYWTAEDAALIGTENQFAGSTDDAIKGLEELLLDAVGIRMVADVPLGAFLSGGIDSSTVVALMQAQSARPVKTFSIGFEEDSFNEARYAKKVAAHLGTDHTELYLSGQDALDVVPRLPDIYDEPFADASQIPTFLVSRMARRDVTVALSGDGGDELFGGYRRHVAGPAVWKRLSKVPVSLRRLTRGALYGIPKKAWNILDEMAGETGRKYAGQSGISDAIDKLASVLGAEEYNDLYLTWVSRWGSADGVTERGYEDSGWRTRLSSARLEDNTDRTMFLDLIQYLPDDILTKVDRASMAVSLEARVPFLDHRVIEYAWRLPRGMKIRGGEGKWILRQVLEKYVPKDLTDRPKAGFGVPLSRWLRGPLRDWAEPLLDEQRLRSQGFFKPTPIRRAWEEHLAGRGRHQENLWTVLMFQAWLEKYNST